MVCFVFRKIFSATLPHKTWNNIIPDEDIEDSQEGLSASCSEGSTTKRKASSAIRVRPGRTAGVVIGATGLRAVKELLVSLIPRGTWEPFPGVSSYPGGSEYSE